MEDIYDIYEPIYRESTKLPGIILFILLGILLLLLTLFIIKKIRNKKNPVTPEMMYKEVIEKLTNLQTDINTISSYDFSTLLSSLYKNYMSNLYILNFRSDTAEELFFRLNDDKSILRFLFINCIEPSLFGKKEVKIEDRKTIIKECVESITEHYKQNGDQID